MVETINFPMPNENDEIKNSWAIHQLNTTADYARSNHLVSFFFGGLNFHIEHHLFQKICHVHHRAISHILKRTAMEYALPYHDIPTISSAVKSHWKFLESMGKSTL
jgi:linoleoyl-CoA desaturase